MIYNCHTPSRTNQFTRLPRLKRRGATPMVVTPKHAKAVLPYNARQQKTVRELRQLRQHPLRSDVDAMSAELCRIGTSRDMRMWSTPEEHAFRQLFAGNIDNSLVLGQALDRWLGQNEQLRLRASSILTGGDPKKMADRYAALHGRTLNLKTHLAAARVVRHQLY